MEQIRKNPYKAGIEISVHISLEAQDLLFSGWACKRSENFNGKGPDFKEMCVLACLSFIVISYTVIRCKTTNLYL